MNVYIFREIAKLFLEWFDLFIFLLATHDSPGFLTSSLALGFIATLVGWVFIGLSSRSSSAFP